MCVFGLIYLNQLVGLGFLARVSNHVEMIISASSF